MKSAEQKKNEEKEAVLNKKAKELLWREAFHEVWPMTIGGLAMIISSYANQAVPNLMGRLMDPASSKGESKCPNNAFINNILWLGLVGGSSSFLRTMMLNRAHENIAARLRKEAFTSLIVHRELEWFHMEDGASTPAKPEPKTESEKGTENGTQSTPSSQGMTPAGIGVILKDDVDTVAEFSSTLANLLRSTSSCVFGTYHMLCLNSSLVGLSLLVAPAVGAVSWMTRKYLKKILAIQQEAAVNAASFLEERLNNIRLVKTSNRETDEIDRYSVMQDEYLKLGSKSAMASGLSMGTMFFLSSSSLCGILLAGGKAVESKRMNHGQLLSFGTYSFMLALGTAGIVRAMGDYMKGVQCAKRLYRLIHDPEDEEAHSDSSKSSAQNKKAVDVSSVQKLTLENLFFSYKCDPSKEVLQDISLTFSRGEIVVVTGKNGAGKSTVAALLGGLFKPKSGSILVHSGSPDSGIPATSMDYSNEIDRKDQAKLVQVVPQMPALFNSTILENVRYSRPEASEEEVVSALKAANCDSFLSRLEGGVNYQVGRNGSRLSGGQKQRLGLARAMLADPVLLVLDEPASSLDAEGETAVSDAIEACRASHRALLVITHRAKTLELADRVVVLKEGKVVEEGALSELQKKSDGELAALMPDLN